MMKDFIVQSGFCPTWGKKSNHKCQKGTEKEKKKVLSASDFLLFPRQQKGERESKKARVVVILLESTIEKTRHHT